MKMINDFYNLLFFHFYKSFIKSGEENIPVFSAVLVFSFAILANVLTVFIIADVLGIEIFSLLARYNKNNIGSIVLAGVVLALNYLYITDEKRYEKIIKEYSKRPLEQRKKGARITLFYALGSILLVFILAPLRVM